MKVYVNRQPKYGPWGGGAKTVNKLVKTLLSKGHTVVYRLEKNIDIIFCFDPRPNVFGEDISHIYTYKRAFPKTKIIQRVGDVGTHSKPHLTELVKSCLPKSDYFIFPSEWSKDYVGFQGNNCSVIYNCPMSEFYKNRNKSAAIPSKPRVVTHHWSTNPKKGFKMYEKFDEYCYDTGEFEFHYIGQKPKEINFNNHIEPVSTDKLVDILPNYDIYLTASEEEAGANHVLESLACGLPIAYHENGGSIPEYCVLGGRGYSNFMGMLRTLRQIRDDYSKYKEECLRYVDTSDSVVNKYYRIMEKCNES